MPPITVMPTSNPFSSEVKGSPASSGFPVSASVAFGEGWSRSFHRLGAAPVSSFSATISYNSASYFLKLLSSFRKYALSPMWIAPMRSTVTPALANFSSVGTNRMIDVSSDCGMRGRSGFIVIRINFSGSSDAGLASSAAQPPTTPISANPTSQPVHRALICQQPTWPSGKLPS